MPVLSPLAQLVLQESSRTMLGMEFSVKFKNIPLLKSPFLSGVMSVCRVHNGCSLYPPGGYRRREL
jgi:hypothetical protein